MLRGYSVQIVDSCISRPDVLQCSVVQITCQKSKQSASMTHVASESKLRLVVRSSMYPCQGYWVAIGRAVMYYARDAQAVSAEIKYRHCMGWRPPLHNQWLCVTRFWCILQYRHLIPAPVDRTSASAWLYKHQWMECQKNKPSTSKANVALNQIHVQLRGHLRFHAQKTGWRSGERSCIMPGLPTHLVQELNVGIVAVMPNGLLTRRVFQWADVQAQGNKKNWGLRVGNFISKQMQNLANVDQLHLVKMGIPQIWIIIRWVIEQVTVPTFNSCARCTAQA